MLPRSDPSPHHRPLLLTAVLLLQVLLLFSARFLPISAPRRSHHPVAPTTPAAAAQGPACPLGRIFVYDIPATFNSDIAAACDELDPWGSRCAALSNGGFGPLATDLAGLIPAGLLPCWFSTDQFAGEVIFHRRILNHRCRTNDSSSAAAFYIPFYAGLAVGKYLWLARNDNNTSGDSRDYHSRLLLQWLGQQTSWANSGGRKQFLMLGRITWDFRRSHDKDWGSSLLYMAGMENVTRLLIERNPWDYRDIGVPYPTGFHPRTTGDVRAWQEFVLRRNRTTLFGFAGATRREIKGDFRGVLVDQCERAGPACRFVDCGGAKCGNRSREAMELFLDSVFCLQPRGDSYTRRSVFDCMLAGAIPVLFWQRSSGEVQYEWYFGGGNYSSRGGEWSVMVDRGGLRNGSVGLKEVLEGVGDDKVRRMRERVVELLPRLVYAAVEEAAGDGEVVEDAFEVAVDGVLKRFRREEEEEESRRRHPPPPPPEDPTEFAMRN